MVSPRGGSGLAAFMTGFAHTPEEKEVQKDAAKFREIVCKKYGTLVKAWTELYAKWYEDTGKAVGTSKEGNIIHLVICNVIYG